VRVEEVTVALRDALPGDSLVTDPDVVDGYRFDRAMTVRPGVPVALVRARSTEEVRRRCGWPRASGSPW
jgi:glycolate oxidase